MPQRTIRVGWVKIRSTDPPISLTVRVFDRPDVTAGYGGWEEVARPRRRPLTTWQGTPALRMTLPLLLDNFRAGLSIERQVTQIQRLATATSASGEPPVLTIDATGSAIPYQARKWVVDSITYGDAVMNQNGNRTRQQVTLSLLEHVDDVYLRVTNPAGRVRQQAADKRAKPGASSKRINARRASSARRATPHARAGSDDERGLGEDLLSIAARELGDANRWMEIAALNGIRDPRSIEPGQVIRLP